MKRFIIISILLISGFVPSLAEVQPDSVGFCIHYRQNSARIERTFMDNGRILDGFVSAMKEKMSDPSFRIDEIYIRSGASPEGAFDNNRVLSMRRASMLRYYLQKALSLPADRFVIDAVGEDWAAFRQVVENSDIPDRGEVLDILDRYSDYIYGHPETVALGPKKELMDLNGGTTWRWLLQNVFPFLRSAGNSVVCRYSSADSGKSPESVVSPPEAGNGADTLVVIHKYYFSIDTVGFTGELPFRINTDSIVDTVFSPNLEIRVPDGKTVGVAVDNKVVIPQKK